VSKLGCALTAKLRYVMATNYPNLARRASQLLLLKVRDALAGHARSPRNKRTNLLALQIDDLKSSVARRPQHHNLSTQARTSQSQLQKRISYRPPSSTRPPSVPNISPCTRHRSHTSYRPSASSSLSEIWKLDDGDTGIAWRHNLVAKRSFAGPVTPQATVCCGSEEVDDRPRFQKA
jgi:hypothetical protein